MSQLALQQIRFSDDLVRQPAPDVDRDKKSSGPRAFSVYIDQKMTIVFQVDIQSTRPTLHIISELGSPLVDVVQEMDVIVKPDKTDAHNFVASFPLANLNASGDTVGESIDNLRATIIDRFLYFSDHADKLGREPLRQLSILQGFVKRRGQNGSNNQ